MAALVVCANTAAARAGDDDDSESFTSKFMRVLGLKNPGTTESSIEYGERSPLVVPPTRDLPPPVTAGPPPAPNWPKDPDVEQRAKAKVKEKVVPHNDNVRELSRPLSPGELNVPGANTSAGDAAGPNGSSQQTTAADTGAKKSIFSFDWFKKEEYATFTGEPGRASLTDPPPGYLTPSPDQPYGIGPEKKQYKVPTVADRAEPAR
ncbi:MAG: hypothetical protein ABSC37_14455 [Xanthobacteraceae bacterium]